MMEAKITGLKPGVTENAGRINAVLIERRYRRNSISRSRHVRIKILLRRLLMNTHSISRRKFAHLLGVGAAAAIVRPRFTIAAEQPPKTTSTSSGIVRLSANENPYGPSARAHEAMKNAHPASNRYPDEANDLLIDKIAKINN